MKLEIIRAYPAVIGNKDHDGGIHESCFRSYQCVQKIRQLLEYRTPPEVILEIIEDIKSAPKRTKDTAG